MSPASYPHTFSSSNGDKAQNKSSLPAVISVDSSPELVCQEIMTGQSMDRFVESSSALSPTESGRAPLDNGLGSGVAINGSRESIKRSRRLDAEDGDKPTYNNHRRGGDRKPHRKSKKHKEKRRHHSQDVMNHTKPIPALLHSSPLSTSTSPNSFVSTPSHVLALSHDKFHKKLGSGRPSLKRNPENSMDDYLAFIKKKMPTPGRKVKTTMELLEEIQSRKSTPSNISPGAPVTTNNTNDSAMMEVIELDDSDSEAKDAVKEETEDTETNDDHEMQKFESVEAILSRLPPIDRNWMCVEEPSTPVCTCVFIYSTPLPNKSIFDEETDIPASPSFEEKIDAQCQAANFYSSSPVSDMQVYVLHNCFIPDVNGTSCDGDLQFGSKKKPICQMDCWGLKAYYDCSRRVFYNVVPKYNYLDYSLDRCVKSIAKYSLSLYDPVQATPDSKQWLDEMEENTSRELETLNTGSLKNDDISAGKVENHPATLNANKTQLDYGDDVMSLPLNLHALSAAVGLSSYDINGDLSYIFKINYHSDLLSYSVCSDPVTVCRFNHLNDITRVFSDMLYSDDSKISSALSHDATGLSTSSSCCPNWLYKLSRDENFREWHEAVVKVSYNGEPLTILPYIVID